MMKRSCQPGFTLLELLVAVALFGVMAVGLASFNGMVFGDQYRKFADLTVANGATLVRRAFDSAMGSATYIQDPSTGAATGYLTAWANLDADGSTPLVAGAQVQFSHCQLALGVHVSHALGQHVGLDLHVLEPEVPGDLDAHRIALLVDGRRGGGRASGRLRRGGRR